MEEKKEKLSKELGTLVKAYNILPLAAKGHPVVVMSRNPLATLKEMNSITINLILAVMDSLRDALVFNTDGGKDVTKLRTTNIPIPYDVISRNKDTKSIEEQLKECVKTTVSYRYRVPGINAEVVSGIITAVERVNGKYMVDISQKAIPWLFYCGQEVGYAKVERDVVAQLPVYQQRLLLYLYGITDSVTNRAKKRLLLDEAVDICGVENAWDSRIQEFFASRILKPLKNNLVKYGSDYILEYSSIVSEEQSTGKGRPKSIGFLIEFYRKETHIEDNIKNKKEIDTRAYNILESMFKHIRRKRKTVTPLVVFDELISRSLQEDFLMRVGRLKVTDNKYYYFNKIAVILQHEYGIVLYED